MKLKKCSICGKDVHLFKSIPPTCANCYKPKAINKVSKKQKETLELYKPKRLKYLDENTECEALLPGCTVSSTEIHHLEGKATRALYLDENNWMAICRNCHNIVETMGEEVYDLQLKIRRNAN